LYYQLLAHLAYLVILTVLAQTVLQADLVLPKVLYHERHPVVK
jgi:hypothetical protein